MNTNLNEQLSPEGSSATYRILFITALLCLCMCASFTTPASACETPRFRFFLEIWPADIYRVVVFHKGEPGGRHREAADWLASKSATEVDHSNYVLRFVDVTEDIPVDLEAAWQQVKGAELPIVAALYPQVSGINAVFYSAPLSMESAKQVYSSPARREVADRITGGDAAVWVLLESGDSAADARAEQTLTEQLPLLLEKYRPLVKEQIDPEFAAENELDLDFGFSVLKVAVDDPGEKAFVNMLLYSEPGLTGGGGIEQPIVFPVYGRARALYALAGSGISGRWLDEAAAYITQECDMERCEVKAQNMGVDMLAPADWTAPLKKTWIRESTHLTSISGALDTAALAESAETAQTDPVYDEPVTEKRSGGPVRIAALSAVVLAAFLLLAGLFFRKRSGS